jgi:hypothetical protein
MTIMWLAIMSIYECNNYYYNVYHNIWLAIMGTYECVVITSMLLLLIV